MGPYVVASSESKPSQRKPVSGNYEDSLSGLSLK